MNVCHFTLTDGLAMFFSPDGTAEMDRRVKKSNATLCHEQNLAHMCMLNIQLLTAKYIGLSPLLLGLTPEWFCFC